MDLVSCAGVDLWPKMCNKFAVLILWSGGGRGSVQICLVYVLPSIEMRTSFTILLLH